MYTDDCVVSDADKFCSVISGINTKSNLKKNNKGIQYYNIAASFDIETTSFYFDGVNNYTYEQICHLGIKERDRLTKCAIMYVWQVGIDGHICIGRTWDEFIYLLDRLQRCMDISIHKRLIIYVHNLSYEFQFMRKRLTWHKVFATEERKVVYAITDGGYEFRCSYILSGYSLDMLGKQLTKYKCSKAVGNLDYRLLRHAQTALTEQELIYCVNDVRVVMNYIQERLESEGNITRLPLTKTGMVRKHCRKLCIYGKDGWKYKGLIKGLRIADKNEFAMIQRAFAGGFTHANAHYSGDTLHNVSSYDFTSSYPYVMVSERFPMSSAVRVVPKSKQEFDTYLNLYCCVFDVEFNDIVCSVTADNPISYSKCVVLENAVNNNGRLVCAKRAVMTITDVDFAVIRKFYHWSSARVGTMLLYKRGYLPTTFVRAILDLYANKTLLKGVAGKEKEYLSSKEMLNSCYGMCVTNPLRDIITYEDGKWGTDAADIDSGLQTYNDSKNRFLYYLWGVFCTSYARRNLFTGIYACKDDYVYSDTDSIKIMNADKYKVYFDTYNNRVCRKLRAACMYHGFDFELCAPQTIEGVTKMLGVWDYEGTYEMFKTLGAKRYMTLENGKLSVTISGVNKHAAVPYLERVEGGAFANFTDAMVIPAEYTGKLIHTYIDDKRSGTITDYNGVACCYEELSSVHLEPTTYNLSISVNYIKYLQGLRRL